MQDSSTTGGRPQMAGSHRRHDLEVTPYTSSAEYSSLPALPALPLQTDGGCATPSSTLTPALARPLYGQRLAVRPGSRLQRLLLAGGAAGPVLFAAAYTLEGLARPGYDAVRETISSLSLGSDGWLQVANFVVFGLLIMLSAPAWRAALAPGRGAAAIPIAKVAIGVGLILAGIFETAPADAAVVGLGGTLHNVASYVALGGTWISTFLFAARFAREPGWRWWAVVAVISGA